MGGGLSLEASGGGEAARPLPRDDVEDVLLVGVAGQGRVHLGLHLGLATVDAAAVPAKTQHCQI